MKWGTLVSVLQKNRTSRVWVCGIHTFYCLYMCVYICKLYFPVCLYICVCVYVKCIYGERDRDRDRYRLLF